MASTWNTMWIGLVDKWRLHEIQEIVYDKVDEFINDYLAVNLTQNVDQLIKDTGQIRPLNMDQRESEAMFFGISESEDAGKSSRCIPPEVLSVEIIDD
ncbi:MAG: hypothetical protein DRP41_07245 [Thermodesulfobacteriota bacterium]|nr:MAG: hypothetical protein DRP41_07245 [Thermodesulfobacteriota bacterium]